MIWLVERENLQSGRLEAVACIAGSEIEMRRLGTLAVLNNIEMMRTFSGYRPELYQGETFRQLEQRPVGVLLDGKLAGTLMAGPLTSVVLSPEEAYMVQEITAVDSKERLIGTAIGNAKASYASGRIGLNELMDDLHTLQEASICHTGVLSHFGLVKNGLGPGRSVKLSGARQNMAWLRENLPPASIPEDATHAVYPYSIKKDGPWSVTIGGQERLVMGKVERRKFISLASVIPR